MAFILFVCGLFVGYVIYCVFDFFWERGCYPNRVQLTFLNFLTLYQANPNEWELFSRVAKYKDFFIEFSFIDFRKYRSWFSKKERQEKKEQELKNTEDFTKAFRADLKEQEEKEARRFEEEIRKRLVQSPSLTLTKPVEDNRERIIIKYKGKLPE